MRWLLFLLLVSTCSAQQQILLSGWATVPLSGGTGSGSVSNLFVDSILGSDSNTGASNSPFATLAKVTSALSGSTAATNIFLKRGSSFYESWSPPTNSYIRAYGTGPKPIMSGATNLVNANFSLVAGQSNVYQYSFTPTYWSNYHNGSSVTMSNVAMMWENDTRLGKALQDTGAAARLADVITNAAPQWWYDKGNHLIYVKLTGSRNPSTNSFTYAASVRKLVIYEGAGFTMEDVQAEKGYEDTTSHTLTEQSATTDGHFIRCVFRQGYNHCAGVANSGYNTTTPLIYDSCIFADPDPYNSGDAAPTAFVAYKDLVTAPYPLTYLTNCSAYASNIVAGNIGYFAHHTTAGSFANCVVSNSYAMGWDYAASTGYPSEDMDSPIGFTTMNCNIAVKGSGQYRRAINITNFGTGEAFQGKATNVTGVTAYGATAIAIVLTSTDGRIGVTNCSMLGSGGGTYAIQVPSAAVPVATVSNKSSGMVTFYSANPGIASNSVYYSDWNDYFDIGSSFSSGFFNSNNSYSEWLAAYPALDMHSVTTDPAIVTPWSPTNYLYAVAADSPAVVIQPVSMGVTEGTNATFTVAAQGIHTLYYQWKKTGTNVTGATSTAYTVTSPQLTDNGSSIACVITNDIGSVTSQTATLTVSAAYILTPTNITGYPSKAWYVASNVVSGPVGTWKDLYTNGLDLTAGGSTRPALNSGALNGLNTLSFNGVSVSGSCMTNTAFSQSQPWEIAMVVALTNNALGATLMDGSTRNLIRNDTTDGKSLWMNAGSSSVKTCDIITNKWIVLNAVWNGASSAIWTNAIAGSSVSPGANSISGLFFGCRSDGANQQAMEVAEVAAYATNLTTALRSNLYYYFTNKYNIAP